jgi:hypothetical protein
MYMSVHQLDHKKQFFFCALYQDSSHIKQAQYYCYFQDNENEITVKK